MALAENAPEDAAAPGLAGLLDELRWRGMLHQYSNGLPERLASGRPIRGYIGFDPTAPTLHVGSLVPIFGLIHLQRAGGIPVIVVGGGTAMVGDPSGRSAERNLLDRSLIEANTEGIRAQLEHFLDFGGPNGAIVVDNFDWLGRYGLLEFLREIGKHFSVPEMLKKDSVQLRLDNGMSFTEFSYMLLQSADFLHLFRDHGVEMQMGGADQWGNITAGLELIRKVLGPDAAATADAGTGASEAPKLAYALSYPLLTNPSGEKFGKTAAGTSVWLDAERTPPYEFYQYWLNADDRDAPTYLRWFTLFDRARIEALEAEAVARPEARPMQRSLAYDLTARVHGAEAADRAVRVSQAKFSGEPIRDPEVLEALSREADAFSFAGEWLGSALVLAVESGTYGSRGEARRAIQQGGLSINGVRIADPEAAVPEPIAGEYLVLRAGKKRVRVGRLRR